eukprot:361208-Chlamydomonas_euryale.AAC.5
MLSTTPDSLSDGRMGRVQASESGGSSFRVRWPRLQSQAGQASESGGPAVRLVAITFASDCSSAIGAAWPTRPWRVAQRSSSREAVMSPPYLTRSVALWQAALTSAAAFSIQVSPDNLMTGCNVNLPRGCSPASPGLLAALISWSAGPDANVPGSEALWLNRSIAPIRSYPSWVLSLQL